MKIYSQLEKAQFECVASASPTPTPLGRVYADITAPTAALPRFYDGTAWREIVMSNTIASYSSSVTGIVNSQIATNAAIASSKIAFTATQYTKVTASGTGTYNTPSGATRLRGRIWGGGGGGSGSGTASGGNGTAGTLSYFRVGASPDIIIAPGGAGGVWTGTSGAAGGTAPTVNSPAIGGGYVGHGGSCGPVVLTSGASTQPGGAGGAGYFGGSAPGSGGNVAGADAAANSGGGGQGGGTQNSGATNYAGNGGGSGAYVEFVINSPAATYAYQLGAGGAGGSAGTNGRAGGAGGSGSIEIWAEFN